MANLVTDFQTFLSNLNLLKNNFKNLVSNEVENELSKYLRKGEEIKVSWHSNIINSNIFLLDEDYGLIYDYDILLSGSRQKFSRIFFIPVYKSNDKYLSISIITYSFDKPLDIFIKELVSDLKKKNIIRKRNKEKREFIRATKKYNL